MTEIFTRMWTELQGFVSAGSVGGYVALGLYILSLLLVLFSMLKGWMRGFYRQAVRFVTVIASMVGALILCSYAYPWLYSLCDGRTLGELLTALHLDFLLAGRGAFASVLASVSGDTLGYAAVVPLTSAVLPLLLVAAYAVLSTVLLLVHSLICHIFGWAYYTNGLLSRVVGTLLGALQGGAVALLVLFGVFSFTHSTSLAVSEAPADSQVRVTYETYFQTAHESALGDAVRALGGKQIIFSIRSQACVGEEKVDAETMTVAAGAIYGHAEKLNRANLKQLTDDQVAALRAIVSYAKHDGGTSRLMAGLCHAFADSATDVDALLPMQEPHRTVVREMLRALAATDERTVQEDLRALTEAYIVLMQTGVLKETDLSIAECLLGAPLSDGRRPLVVVGELLASSENTEPLLKTVAHYALTVMGEDDAGATLGELLFSLHSMLPTLSACESAEEYRVSCAGMLTLLLNEQGLGVSSEAIVDTAERMTDRCFGTSAGQVTDTDLISILLSALCR